MHFIRSLARRCCRLRYLSALPRLRVRPVFPAPARSRRPAARQRLRRLGLLPAAVGMLLLAPSSSRAHNHRHIIACQPGVIAQPASLEHSTRSGLYSLFTTALSRRL